MRKLTFPVTKLLMSQHDGHRLNLRNAAASPPVAGAADLGKFTSAGQKSLRE